MYLLLNPVVFVHGLLVKGRYYECYTHLRQFFNQLGIDLFIYKRPSGVAMDARADLLADFLDKNLRGRKFHIIGHSAGGPDSRLAIFKHNILDAVTLTTMGSPHHGTPVADRIISGEVAPKVFDYIFDKYEVGEQIVKEMTTDYMEYEFNPRVKNIKSCAYYSMAFYIESIFKIDFFSMKNYMMLKKAGHKYNDGTVPFSSQLMPDSVSIGSHLMTSEFAAGTKGTPCEHKAETFEGMPYAGDRNIWKKNFRLVVDNLIKFESSGP